MKRIATNTFLLFKILCIVMLVQACGGGGDSAPAPSNIFSNHQQVENKFNVSVNDGVYNAISTINFQLTFPLAVDVSGNPRLELDLAGAQVYANYVSGSGSTVLNFEYNVSANEVDLDGIDLITNIDLNGGNLTFENAGQTLDCNTTLDSLDTTGVIVDAQNPVIANFTKPADATYIENNVLTFLVDFSENVIVSGTPRLTLNIAGATAYALYTSGSTTSQLTFEYTVQNTDIDLDGISVNAPIDLNSATIEDVGNNTASISFIPPSLSGVILDANASNVTLTSPANILASNETSYSLSGTCSENTEDVIINIGTILIAPNPVCTANAWSASVDVSSLADNANIAITVDHDSATQVSANVVKDSQAPSISNVAITSKTYSLSELITISVTFDDIVNVSATPRIKLNFESQSASNIYASYAGGSATNTLSFTYNVGSGDADANGIDLQGSIDLNGSTIQDANTNSANLNLSTINFPSVLVDSSAPFITSFIEPADGTYAENGVLLFQVNFSEAIVVSGSPRIELNIGGVTRYANYQTGSGTSGLEFSYTIVAADDDSDGIQVTNSAIELNSGTIQALSDNDNSALGFLSYLDATTGVIVDNASGITPPAQVSGVTTAPTTSNSQLSLAWNIPADNGTAIIDYTVQYRQQGTSTWINVNPKPTINSTTVTSLTAGITYEFRVAANNGLLGAYSAISTAEIWDISTLNLALWLDATDASSLFTDSGCLNQVTTNLDDVACWADKSGFGRNLIQTNAAKRPSYLTSAISSLPGLDFDGAGDYMVDEDGENYINGFSSFEFFVVVQSDITNTDAGILDTEEPDGADDAVTLRYDKSGASGGCSQCLKGGISIGGGSHVQAESTSSTQTTSAQALGGTWSDGDKFKIYVNGTYSNSWDNGTISGTVADATKLIIGKGPKDSATKGWNGKIVEIIFLNTQLSTGDRTKLLNYLNSKYGI